MKNSFCESVQIFVGYDERRMFSKELSSDEDLDFYG
jgi:hypothetical protein